MEKKVFKVLIMIMLLVIAVSTDAQAASFTATMTPSKKVVPESTEFTVEIKVSNLDVGANGINSLSGHLKYDKNNNIFSEEERKKVANYLKSKNNKK